MVIMVGNMGGRHDPGAVAESLHLKHRQEADRETGAGVGF